MSDFPSLGQAVMLRLTSVNFRNEYSEENASENDSTCIIRLNNSSILYLREITRFLVLVCILRDEAFTKRGKLVRYVLCCWPSSAYLRYKPQFLDNKHLHKEAKTFMCSVEVQ